MVSGIFGILFCGLGMLIVSKIMKSNSKLLSNNYEKLKNNVSNLRSSSAEDRIKKLKKLKKILDNRNNIKAALKRFQKNGSEVDLTEIFPVVQEINHTVKNLKWMKSKRVNTYFINRIYITHFL